MGIGAGRMELPDVQARELSIRIGAILANHIFSLDSLEALDLTTAMSVLEGKALICSDRVEQLEHCLDELQGAEDDLSEIGSILGDRYMETDDIIEKIAAMQRKLTEYEGSK